MIFDGVAKRWFVAKAVAPEIGTDNPEGCTETIGNKTIKRAGVSGKTMQQHQHRAITAMIEVMEVDTIYGYYVACRFIMLIHKNRGVVR